MDIILIKDVKSLGKKGDLVKVSDGYARNFILPKKLGIEANAKNINDLKLQKKAEEKKEKELFDEAISLSKSLEKMNIDLKLKVGEGGKTFGSISTKEISSAIKEKYNIDIDRKRIQLKEPIKTLGTYDIVVKIHPKVSGAIKTTIVGE